MADRPNHAHRRLSAGAILACAAALSGAPSAAADAHGSWSSYGVAGVHAQGEWKVQYSRLYFWGYVRDTACDANAVSLELAFSRSYGKIPGGGYRSEKVTHRGGCNKQTNFSFNTAYTGNARVVVWECVVDEKCSGGNVAVDVKG